MAHLRPLLRAALCSAALATPTLVVRPAPACGNGVEHRTNIANAAVRIGEQHLEEGRNDQALISALRAVPFLASERFGGSPLGDRAMRVAARAVVRSGGHAAAPRDPFLTKQLWPAETSEQRRHHLVWALQVLEAASARDHDPAALSDWGEALARTPGRGAEGAAVLEPLEARGVISSGYAYAALASTRWARAADAAAWLAAPLGAVHAAPIAVDVARCRRMSKHAGACDH